MKKVAVTGHTNGIGEGIYLYFSNMGYDVKGFSRSNGYDLNEQETLDRIVVETSDYDIFVNNAFNELTGFSQVQLLHKLFPSWKDKEGWIINISSIASDYISGRQVPDPYCITKVALDEYAKQLSWLLPRVNIVTIRPGRVDTQLIKKIPGRKLRVSDIVNTIDWIISQPEDVHINEVTIRVKDPDKYKNV